MNDLVVVGQDPAFGGGALAQMDAFLAAARSLGRETALRFVSHPSLSPDPSASRLDRVETLRVLRGSRGLAPTLRTARTVWVVATVATHGYAAALSGRPYSCWIGTGLADERRGRLPGLRASRRLAAYVNAPALARLERTVLRRAERLFATSEASRASVARAAGLDAADVGILPLPVDADRFTPEPDGQWLARLERPLLATVGRADDSRRNLRLAVDALRLVRSRVPAATLRVIGPGPPSWLAREPGVEALGEVSSVAEPLREASLLLLPSRQEGFGIAVAEALAAGVPVVSTPCGGPEELLRRSGGGVVLDGWEPAEMARQAVSLLGDAGTLVAMRRRGREYVVRHHSAARLRELLAAELT
jgi:glycosyltransferase involved in cell wall biosynthesis